MKRLSALVLSSLVISSCTTAPTLDPMDESSESAADRSPSAALARRGPIWEYDPGPPKNSRWPDLFAETPNYRAYGKAVYQAAFKTLLNKDDREEKFRWKMGPMWYRGRLAPSSVKVFVVGQEGAQDENTSNRTFTGSTGTKMQSFLNFLGIDRSYLFMNTFTYTITGQYGERVEETDSEAAKKEKFVRSQALFWLAQDPGSAIVQHRHKMFDYMLDQNKSTLKVVIGVGTAGKDSVATWIRAHGGDCTAKMLSSSHCDASVLGQGIIAIGVQHPGGASARNGGASAADRIKSDFIKKAQIASKYARLTPDPGMKAGTTFSYRDAAIPFRDFPFGTTWRLGNDGTATNRRGADGIQVYSSQGCYNNKVRKTDGRCDETRSVTLYYEETPKTLEYLPPMASEDVPWESPRNRSGRTDFDEGPLEFAPLLMGNSKDGSVPYYQELGVSSHDSFGRPGSYRGNLKDPLVLVLADQESHDDLFSTRALTGTGGQKFQRFLNALGLKNNYAIIRTLPVDTLDLPTDQVKSIAFENDVIAARNAVLDAVLKQGRTKLILAVGPVATEVMASYKPSVPVVNMDSPNSSSHATQWQKAIKDIGALRITGVRAAATYDGKLDPIPRADLPAHTRIWMGTSGSRAARATLSRVGVEPKVWSGDYYQFNAPSWVSEYRYPADPKNLSQTEKQSLDLFVNQGIPMIQNSLANADFGTGGGEE